MRIRLEDVGQGGPDDEWLQIALKISHKRLTQDLSGPEKLQVLADIKRMELKAQPGNTSLPSPQMKSSKLRRWVTS